MLGSPAGILNPRSASPRSIGPGNTVPMCGSWNDVKQELLEARARCRGNVPTISKLSQTIGLTASGHNIDVGSTTAKYWGGSYYKKLNKVVFWPYNGNAVLILDLATETLSKGATALTGSNKFRGAVPHQNGTTYVAPFSNDGIGSYAPDTDVFTPILYSIPSILSAYEGCSQMADGNVYVSPHDTNATSVAATYTVSGTTATVTLTAHKITLPATVYLDFTTGAVIPTDGQKEVQSVTADTFTVTVTAGDGPSGAVNITTSRQINKINVAAGSISDVGGYQFGDGGSGTSTFKNEGCCTDASGQYLIGAALWMRKLMRYQLDSGVTTNETSLYALDGSVDRGKCRGNILMLDDRILFTPYDATKLMAYNPATKRAEVLADVGGGSGTNQWTGQSYGGDGYIYLCPRGSRYTLQVDAITGSTVLLDTGDTATNKWAGFVTTPQGIYGAPFDNTQVLKIDTKQRLSPELCESPFINHF